MLTFLDNTHGENGRAQTAHSGAPAAPAETDMTRAQKATIARNRQRRPPPPPPYRRHGGSRFPSTCMRTTHKHIHNAILKGACGSGSCYRHTSLWRVTQFSHIDLRARLPNHLPRRRPGGPAPTSRTGAGSAAVASAGSAVPAEALMHRWCVATASAHAQRNQPAGATAAARVACCSWGACTRAPPLPTSTHLPTAGGL